MTAYHRRNKRYQHARRVSRPFNFLNQRANVSFGKLALINARGEVAVGTTRTTKRNVNIEASVSHLMSNDNNTHVYYFTFVLVPFSALKTLQYSILFNFSTGTHVE